MQTTEAAAREMQDGSASLQTSNGAGIPFNGSQVRKAVALLPVEQADALVWLFEHGKDHHLNLETLAADLRRARPGDYSQQMLSTVFRGRFRGTLDALTEAVLAYRSLVQARANIGRQNFVTTKLTRRIRRVCDHARAYQRVALLFGDGQIGKSKNLQEYARTTYNTRYLRLPTEASLRLTADLLGRACYLNVQRSGSSTLRADVVAHFDAGMLLIVDELQQITLARRERDRLATVEFLREIFDTSGCGLVLCGTNEAMREIESGPNALWLRQLRRRALPKVMLPNVAGDDDILAFAAHYGLGDDVPPAAIAEARRIAAEDGVGLLITYLQGAARMAAAERVAVTWQHFLRTHKAFSGETEVSG